MVSAKAQINQRNSNLGRNHPKSNTTFSCLRECEGITLTYNDLNLLYSYIDDVYIAIRKWSLSVTSIEELPAKDFPLELIVFWIFWESWILLEESRFIKI